MSTLMEPSAMGLGRLWVDGSVARALGGLGIAIGHLVLTDNDIREGRLLEAWPRHTRLAGGYHLILAKRAARSSRGTHASGVGDERGHRVSQDVGSALLGHGRQRTPHHTLAVNIAVMGLVLVAGARQMLATLAAPDVASAILQAAVTHDFGWVMLCGGLGAWLTAALSLAVLGRRRGSPAQDVAPGVAGVH
jgi:hypothetical protein